MTCSVASAVARKAAHPEDAKAERRRYYQAHKKQMNAYTLQWSREHKDRKKASENRRRAAKAQSKGSHTAQDISRLLTDQNGLCRGCGKDIQVQYTVDHIIPLCRGGSNGPENIQLLCGSCNSRKRHRTMDEWLASKGVV